MKKVRISILTFLLASACGSDGSDNGSESDQALADQLIVKAKECDVYRGPAENPDKDAVRDDFDRCAARCILDATCEDLQLLFCSDKGGSESFASCAAKCPAQPDDGFACDSGAKIPLFAVCDGVQDCADADDEDGCNVHICDNGEMVTNDNSKCDGSDDCTDGSDETGCPSICG